MVITVTIALTVTNLLYAKQLHIVTTYNYIASITQHITGNTATVTPLASPQFDHISLFPNLLLLLNFVMLTFLLSMELNLKLDGFHHW
jgi:hypothetical protein